MCHRGSSPTKTLVRSPPGFVARVYTSGPTSVEYFHSQSLTLSTNNKVSSFSSFCDVTSCLAIIRSSCRFYDCFIVFNVAEPTLAVVLCLLAGSSGIEVIIQDELKHFLHVLEQTKGKAVDIKHQLTQTVSNVITSLIFGNRFDYSEDQLANLQITEFRDVFEKTKFIPFIRVSRL